MVFKVQFPVFLQQKTSHEEDPWLVVFLIALLASEAGLSVTARTPGRRCAGTRGYGESKSHGA